MLGEASLYDFGADVPNGEMMREKDINVYLFILEMREKSTPKDAPPPVSLKQ